MRARLEPERAGFEWRQRGGLVQLWYGWPRLHYEAWFHRRTERLEVGLHFEADPATNARLLDYFAEHLIVAKAELSEWVEAEGWDRGWARVYLMLPLEPLDDAFLDRVAERLASAITCLQPLLEAAVVEIGAPGRPVRAEGGEPRVWSRRRRQPG